MGRGAYQAYLVLVPSFKVVGTQPPQGKPKPNFLGLGHLIPDAKQLVGVSSWDPADMLPIR
jgi:hypothetical protein